MTRISASLMVAVALALSAACGGSDGGGGTTGTGGHGGTGGGLAGRTGSGGSNGAGGQAGGHVGTGGATGGGGSAGRGGVAGGAGQGAGGGAGQGVGGTGDFDCTGVSLDGDCSAYPVGLVCALAGEAALPCVCVPATGGPKWQCNAGAPCPYTEGSAGVCSLSTLTTIANLGGCKYPPDTVCSCEAADGGAAWSCNEAACPATPPTGACPGSPAPNVTCSYEGSSVNCACVSNGGATRWICNGKTTPDCPSSWPGGGVDCSSFQPGTLCSYPAGNVTGGPCTCGGNGTSLTWHCGNG